MSAGTSTHESRYQFDINSSPDQRRIPAMLQQTIYRTRPGKDVCPRWRCTAQVFRWKCPYLSYHIISYHISAESAVHSKMVPAQWAVLCCLHRSSNQYHSIPDRRDQGCDFRRSPQLSSPRPAANSTPTPHKTTVNTKPTNTKKKKNNKTVLLFFLTHHTTHVTLVVRGEIHASGTAEYAACTHTHTHTHITSYTQTHTHTLRHTHRHIHIHTHTHRTSDTLRRRSACIQSGPTLRCSSSGSNSTTCGCDLYTKPFPIFTLLIICQVWRAA